MPIDKPQLLVNRKQVRLDEQYVLISSSDEEIDYLNHLYQEGLNDDDFPWLNNIELFGHTNDATNGLLRGYIPKVGFGYDHNGKKIDEYKCYCNENRPRNQGNIIIHEDALSSFNCIVQKMGFPSHVIIVREKQLENESISQGLGFYATINSNDETNHNNDTTVHTESTSVRETEEKVFLLERDVHSGQGKEHTSEVPETGEETGSGVQQWESTDTTSKGEFLHSQMFKEEEEDSSDIDRLTDVTEPD